MIAATMYIAGTVVTSLRRTWLQDLVWCVEKEVCGRGNEKGLYTKTKSPGICTPHGHWLVGPGGMHRDVNGQLRI
jgi:hypothetical protein